MPSTCMRRRETQREREKKREREGKGARERKRREMDLTRGYSTHRERETQLHHIGAIAIVPDAVVYAAHARTQNLRRERMPHEHTYAYTHMHTASALIFAFLLFHHLARALAARVAISHATSTDHARRARAWAMSRCVQIFGRVVHSIAHTRAEVIAVSSLVEL